MGARAKHKENTEDKTKKKAKTVGFCLLFVIFYKNKLSFLLISVKIPKNYQKLKKFKKIFHFLK